MGELPQHVQQKAFQGGTSTSNNSTKAKTTTNTTTNSDTSTSTITPRKSSTHSPDFKRTLRLQIAVLTACSMISNAAYGMLAPLLPSFVVGLGLSPAAAGLVVAAPSISRVCVNLPIGVAGDTIGRKPLLIGGALLAAFGAYGTAMAISLFSMLLPRLITGMGFSALDTGVQACKMDVAAHCHSRSGFLLGLMQAMTMLAYAAGPVVGGWLAEAGNSVLPFKLNAAALMACAILYSALPAARMQDGGKGNLQQTCGRASMCHRSHNFSQLFFDRQQQALLCARFSMIAGWSSWLTVLPLHVEQAFDMGSGEFGKMLSFMALIGCATAPVGGFLADRCGYIHTACIGSAATAIAVGSLPCSTSKLVFWTLMALWDIGEAALTAASAKHTAEVTGSQQRGAQAALLMQMQDATFIAMPVALGAVVTRFGTDVALALTAVCMLSGTAGYVYFGTCTPCQLIKVTGVDAA